jgi:hypothetical protein
VVSSTLTDSGRYGCCNIKTPRRSESGSNVDHGSKDPLGSLSAVNIQGTHGAISFSLETENSGEFEEWCVEKL